MHALQSWCVCTIMQLHSLLCRGHICVCVRGSCCPQTAQLVDADTSSGGHSSAVQYGEGAQAPTAWAGSGPRGDTPQVQAGPAKQGRAGARMASPPFAPAREGEAAATRSPSDPVASARQLSCLPKSSACRHAALVETSIPPPSIAATVVPPPTSGRHPPPARKIATGPPVWVWWPAHACRPTLTTLLLPCPANTAPATHLRLLLPACPTACPRYSPRKALDAGGPRVTAHWCMPTALAPAQWRGACGCSWSKACGQLLVPWAAGASASAGSQMTC